MWWRAAPHAGPGVGAALPPHHRPLPRGSCSRRRGQAPRGDDGRTPAARPVTGWPQVRERAREHTTRSRGEALVPTSKFKKNLPLNVSDPY